MAEARIVKFCTPVDDQILAYSDKPPLKGVWSEWCAHFYIGYHIGNGYRRTITNHFYFSFQVDYVVHKINNTHLTTLLHKSNLASRSLLVCCLLYHTVTSSLCSVSKTHASPDFLESVPAASSQPSTDGEHPLHVGLWCRRSCKILRQWGKQWIGCLPSSPEGDVIFFWQRCPKFM